MIKRRIRRTIFVAWKEVWHLEHLKRWIAANAIPIVRRDQALAAGYDLHLTKPVSPSDLTHAVAKFRKSAGA